MAEVPDRGHVPFLDEPEALTALAALMTGSRCDRHRGDPRRRPSARGHIRRTPLLQDAAIDRIAGRRVWIKARCLQVTGSFKARGGWAAVSALGTEARARGVIAYSSGNHAQGVARAAAELGVPALVLMPSDAARVKIARVRASAPRSCSDRATEDRDALGAALAVERGLTLIPPYDDDEVIAGQGTTGLEIAEQAADQGIAGGDVLVCTGGGGLATGIALALAAVAPGFGPAPPSRRASTTRPLAGRGRAAAKCHADRL